MSDYTNLQCQLLKRVDKKHKNQKITKKLRSTERIIKTKYNRYICQPYFRQSKSFLKLQDEYDRIECEKEKLYNYYEYCHEYYDRLLEQEKKIRDRKQHE